MYFTGHRRRACFGDHFERRRSRSPGKPAPFVMELPQYHVPSCENSADACLGTLERVHHQGGNDLVPGLCRHVVFGRIWLCKWRIYGMVEDSADSLLAVIGGVIAPIFAPLGLW